MQIGIDARMYGLEHAGIGRYVKNLVEGLPKVRSGDKYILFARRDNFEEISQKFETNSSFRVVMAEAKHYTLKEQVIFPQIINGLALDLVHFPHFNVPVFSRKRFVVTIHDLLWHEKQGSCATTLPKTAYFVKYLGYKYVFSFAVNKAALIFVPTNWVKNKLLENYNLDPRKILVTYEGVDKQYLTSPESYEEEERVLKKHQITEPYLIYTGSAYPHKNLNFLLDCFEELKERKNSLRLLIACSRSFFWKRLEKEIIRRGLTQTVKLLGFVPDHELKILYRHSLAFVFPSLSEGFGLPGLEAMSSGTPVLAAKNGALEEVYRDAAVFFDPYDKDELINSIFLVQNARQREILVGKGARLARLYDWKRTIKLTVDGYHSAT